MENITDSDYNHAKSICKNFKIKILDEYPDLHLKIDTLLLASKFISVPALVWQAALKRPKLN